MPIACSRRIETRLRECTSASRSRVGPPNCRAWSSPAARCPRCRCRRARPAHPGCTLAGREAVLERRRVQERLEAGARQAPRLRHAVVLVGEVVEAADQGDDAAVVRVERHQRALRLRDLRRAARAPCHRRPRRPRRRARAPARHPSAPAPGLVAQLLARPGQSVPVDLRTAPSVFTYARALLSAHRRDDRRRAGCRSPAYSSTRSSRSELAVRAAGRRGRRARASRGGGRTRSARRARRGWQPPAGARRWWCRPCSRRSRRRAPKRCAQLAGAPSRRRTAPRRQSSGACARACIGSLLAASRGGRVDVAQLLHAPQHVGAPRSVARCGLDDRVVARGRLRHARRCVAASATVELVERLAEDRPRPRRPRRRRAGRRRSRSGRGSRISCLVNSCSMRSVTKISCSLRRDGLVARQEHVARGLHGDGARALRLVARDDSRRARRAPRRSSRCRRARRSARPRRRGRRACTSSGIWS